MYVKVLGPVEMETLSGYVTTPKSVKVRSLLAYLAAYQGKAVSPSRIIEALWSGVPPRTASTALHVHMSKLRKFIREFGVDADSVITTEVCGYRLDPSNCEVDIHVLEQTLEKSAQLIAMGRGEHASDTLKGAISLWRGPAFEDLRGNPTFEIIGRRVDEQRVYACEQRFELELQLGHHKALIREIYSQLDRYVTQENLYEYLLIALYRSGRQVDALEAYGKLRWVLAEDLGVEPSPRLRQLHRAILDHDPCLVGPGLPVLRADG
ncbi:hypothetical protein GCM10022254_20270 [Actinomadura meridiana]|uniref:OmpR/PhoB-type domain-containing protein n=1 Tax=Actinomadura meridiana TaxID=559626 RepID=A0ABP8BWT7_9ACTN